MRNTDRRKKKKRRRIGDLIRLTGLFIALSVLLYPTISNYLYEKNSGRVITSYDEKAVQISESERQEMLEQARQYNEEMLGNIELLDPFSPVKREVDKRYQSLLNVDGNGDDGIYPYSEDPGGTADLPRDGRKGASEWCRTFPGDFSSYRGESTHAVLTGHRGLPSKMLFTDLDELEQGDIFYICILGETLAYQVDQILTVLPEDTDALNIITGKDYVTLVTCTPYAVNTHRLLVRGTRIPYEEAVQKVPNEKVQAELPFQVQMLLLAVLVLILAFLGYQFWKRVKKNRKRGR